MITLVTVKLTSISLLFLQYLSVGLSFGQHGCFDLSVSSDQHICLCVFSNLFLFTYLSACLLSACQCLAFCLFVCLHSVFLGVCPSVCQSACLCLHVFLFVCLSVSKPHLFLHSYHNTLFSLHSHFQSTTITPHLIYNPILPQYLIPKTNHTIVWLQSFPCWWKNA